jgi:HlyD family secretion protein
VRVFGLGTVEARVLSKIGFEVEGAIIDLEADHGDVVKQGAVLARISPAEQEARVAKAKAGLLSAEVGVRRAEANVAKSRAVLAQRLEANKRKKALVRRDVVSEQAAEEAQRDEDVAQAELSVASSEVGVAEANLETARSELALETALLDQHTLTAPFDGIVIERHRELGTVVKSGDPIFTLIATTATGASPMSTRRVPASSRRGRGSRPGCARGRRTSFAGQVLRIGSKAIASPRSGASIIKGDNPPPQVFLGEQVEVWITVASSTRRCWCPRPPCRASTAGRARSGRSMDGRLRVRSSFRPSHGGCPARDRRRSARGRRVVALDRRACARDAARAVRRRK